MDAYDAITQGCGLVDRSDRGKLALTGGDAKDFLHGQVTNDILGLTPGTGCYAAFLTHKGKMIGDLRVLDCGDELWLDTERATLQELFNMIRRFRIGRDVELHKRTVERALFSLVGPRARAVAGADDLPEEEHAHREDPGLGRLVVAGDGIDVICAAERADDVRARLVAAGAHPVPEAAAEVLRVEAGRPRWGYELDESVIPQEAGLNDRAVSFTKGCYVGQETVARLFYKGKPNRHLRGLVLSGPATPGDDLRLGDRVVGRLGTVADSPELGTIALALVRREAGVGDVLAVGDGTVSAEVVEVPFEKEPEAA